MKKLTILLSGFSMPASACPLCNRQIREAIYDSQFYPNLFTMLLAFVVLAIVVLLLTFISKTRGHRYVPFTTACLVLGIGLGGFIDGIFLHQILQTHEMLSNKIPATDYVGKSVNMFWDGIFHAFCLIVTMIGIILLWKATKRGDTAHSGRLLFAGLLAGWAVFNIVEGVIDHQILQLHNVIEYAQDHAPGNYIFLGISVVMFIVAYCIARPSWRTF